MNENFGIIFHCGLYSVPAYDDVKSLKRRTMQNGSEWYLRRLTENSDYRPISGYRETQEYHKKTYGDSSYFDFMKSFNVSESSIDEWMKLVVSIGASYVIITTKHHDGFCLWNTKTTPINSMNALSNNDITKIFVESARKYNLKVGLYYSWSEFNKNMTKEYISNVVEPQMNELMKMNPDIWWFDGHWAIKTMYAKNKINNILDKLKKINKNVEINDRIPDTTKSTFFNFSDRHIPEKEVKCKWEHVNTIGLSWGFNRQQKKSDYKNSDELKNLYDKVMKLGGKFLLNLAPDENGFLDKFEIDIVKKFAE